MIKKPMSKLVEEHFRLNATTEHYLWHTPFTEADLNRICEGEGKDPVGKYPKGARAMKPNKTYADYLAEAQKRKPRR